MASTDGRPCGQSWGTFLRNHLPQIAAMDLFVVPTIGFSLLYVLVIVRLARRELVWINVTAQPTADWIARQITEAFPWNEAPRYLIHDRWKPPIQLEEEQAIAVRELDPTTHLALKHNQLTSERSILSLKPADRSERRNYQPQKEEEQRDHHGRRYVIPSPDRTDEVFSTHRWP